MATNTWQGADTSWNTAGNWSLGHVPLNSEDVVFDNTDVTNCTLDVAAVCLTLTTASNYTGNFSTGGNTLTVSGNCQFGHTGTLTINSTITLNSDGNFGIATSITSFTGGGSLDLQGTGNLDIDEDISASMLYDLTCAASGKTTTNTSANTGKPLFSNQIIIGAGTLTLNVALRMSVISQTTPLVINASATINGTTALDIRCYNTSDLTITIPAMVETGTAQLYIGKQSTGNLIVNLGGNITTGRLDIYSNNATGTMTFNTGLNPYYNITCGALYFGGNVASSTSTFNFNSSTVAITSYNNTYNSGTLNINFGSSVWTCSGTWNWQTNADVGAHTSQVTFTGTGSVASVVNSGTPWYTLIINSAGFTRTLTASNPIVCNTFTLSAGSLTANSNNITAVAGISITGTTVNFGGSACTHTITGNGDYHLSATSLTCTVTSLDLKGTGNLDVDYLMTTSVYFANITCAYSGKTTTNTGSNTTYMNGVLTLGAGTLTSTATAILITCDQATPAVIDAAVTISGGWQLQFNSGTQATVTLPAITMGGTCILRIQKVAAAAVTFNMGGNISAPTVQVRNNEATNSMTFNTGTNPYYNITATTSFACGGSVAGITTVNFNSSTVITASYLNTYNTGTNNINFGSSVWTCSGSWTHGTAHTVDEGTFQVTFTTTGSITSAGLDFYTVIFNGAGQTFTITASNAIICNTLTLSAGSLTGNSNNITAVAGISINGTTVAFGASAHTITITGNGNFHLSATTLSGAGTTLDLKQTGTLDIDGVFSSQANTFSKIICAYAGYVTTNTGSVGTSNLPTCKRLTLGTGTLTLNNTGAGGATNLVFVPDTADWLVNAGATINGVNSFLVRNMTAAAINIPALTMRGTGKFILDTYGSTVNVVVTQTGDITAPRIDIYGYSATKTLTYNVGANNLIANSTGGLYLGNDAAGATIINLGSGTANAITALNIYNTNASAINFQSSQWVCTGNWIYGSNFTVDAGTSQVTFTTTGSITSAGLDFYTVIFNGAGQTFTITASNAIICNTFTLTAGNLTANSNNITAVAGISITGTTVNFGGSACTHTITGDGNYHLSGTCTPTVVNLDLKGTGNLDLDTNNTYFNNITCSYSGEVTTITNGGTACGCQGVLTLGSGGTSGTLTINANLWVSPTASGSVTPLVINGSPTINGNSYLIFSCRNLSEITDYNMPAITMTGTAGIQLYKHANSGAVTYVLGGAISILGNFRMYNHVVNATVIVNNTSNYAISCANYVFDVDVILTTGSFTVNAGSGTISCNKIDNTTSHSSGTIWVYSGTCTCTGNITFSSDSTITLTGSTIDITTSSVTITSAGKTFGILIYNVTGQTLTLTASNVLICASFTLSAGSLTANSNSITSTGSVLITGATINFGASASTITMTGNGSLTVSVSVALTIANVTIDMRGTGTITLPACTIARFICTSSKIYTWNAQVGVITIASHTLHDWDSCTWQSSSGGNHAHISAPASSAMISSLVKDIHNSGTIVNATNNCTDNGNNIGFNWTRVGTGAMTLPILTEAGSGTRISVGTGANTLPILSLSGDGVRWSIATGDLDLPIISLAGDSIKISIGTGSLTLPIALLSGDGIRISIGNGNILIPVILETGNGTRISIGIGSLDLPILQEIANAIRISVGTGSLDLPVTLLLGDSIRISVGTGSLNLPIIDLLGSSVRISVGSGILDLPILDLIGSGVRISIGTGDLDLPIIDEDGDGTHVIIGNGSLTLPILIVLGNGTVIPGTAVISPIAYIYETNKTICIPLIDNNMYVYETNKTICVPVVDDCAYIYTVDKRVCEGVK